VQGLKLKAGKSAAEGVDEWFFGTGERKSDCATAVVLIQHEALINTLTGFFGKKKGMALFDENTPKKVNNVRPDFVLKGGKSTEARGYSNWKEKVTDNVIPGDSVYFSNPGGTDPWEGENAIYLGVEKYFAHGIGIVTAKKIKEKLNSESPKKKASLDQDRDSPEYGALLKALFIKD